MARDKRLPVVARKTEEDAEDAASRAVARTEVVGKPLVLFRKTIHVWHTLGCERAAVPRVYGNEHNVWQRVGLHGL